MTDHTTDCMQQEWDQSLTGFVLIDSHLPFCGCIFLFHFLLVCNAFAVLAEAGD